MEIEYIFATITVRHRLSVMLAFDDKEEMVCEYRVCDETSNAINRRSSNFINSGLSF